MISRAVVQDNKPSVLSWIIVAFCVVLIAVIAALAFFAR